MSEGSMQGRGRKRWLAAALRRRCWRSGRRRQSPLSRAGPRIANVRGAMQGADERKGECACAHRGRAPLLLPPLLSYRRHYRWKPPLGSPLFWSCHMICCPCQRTCGSAFPIAGGGAGVAGNTIGTTATRCSCSSLVAVQVLIVAFLVIRGSTVVAETTAGAITA
ncbi:uncharacterized protein DS421_3g72370 [Arachis hypogaea]|nr:uncharacterized protein DS421_3g72370 [Arachis hypogaea]